MSRVRARAGAALLAAALPTLLSCISERGSPTGPGLDAECRIPVGSGAVGSVQAIVAIRDFAFVPATISVPRGTKVTWVNCEPPATMAHTSESDGDAWSSPLLEPGALFSRTFDEAGSFPYHCGPHPGMRATIVVE